MRSERFISCKKELSKPTATVYTGEVTAALPNPLKTKTALQIHEEQLRRTDSLPVFTPDALVDSMNQGRFVLLFDDKAELMASCQTWSSPNNSSVMECGTWMTFKDNSYAHSAGELVLKEAAKLAKTSPEVAQVITLVDDNNLLAQHALRRIGALDRGYRYSPYSKEPTKVKVFDLINLTDDFWS